MAYKFNPFTGKLDETGSGGATAAGSANEIQYNDGAGGLAASSDFTVDPDWNDASTVFTGLKLNVTDTASAAGSNLLDLQVNGTRAAAVAKDGRSLFGNIATPGFAPAVSNGSLLFGSFGGFGANLDFCVLVLDTNPSKVKLRTDAQFGWTGTTQPTGATALDLALARADAGLLEVTDGSTGTGYIKQDPVLTANLPDAATVGAGTRGFVSDAGTIAFNTDIGTGTGTPSANTTIPVFSDGSVWKAG